MSFDQLRTAAQQLKDEFAATFKRMNDPEEHEKHVRQRRRDDALAALETDAGL